MFKKSSYQYFGIYDRKMLPYIDIPCQLLTIKIHQFSEIVVEIHLVSGGRILSPCTFLSKRIMGTFFSSRQKWPIS